jgi:hypothetical protein
LGATIRQLITQLRDRSPLPAGTTPIVLGLVINGLSTYGFLVLTHRAVGDEAYGGLAVLWALVYILGPGLFQPLEQELARATAARGSRGEGSAPVLHQAAKVGVIALSVVFIGVLVSWPLGLAGMLDNRVDLLIALLLGLAVRCSSWPAARRLPLRSWDRGSSSSCSPSTPSAIAISPSCLRRAAV